MKEFIDTLITALKIVHSNWLYIFTFYGILIVMPGTMILIEDVIPLIRRKLENGINTRNKKR